MRTLLFAAALLPSIVFGKHLYTWCYEIAAEATVKQLEQSGCVIWAIHCQNPDADISERKWIIEYDKPDWIEEKS